jgi:hypothetical protein
VDGIQRDFNVVNVMRATSYRVNRRPHEVHVLKNGGDGKMRESGAHSRVQLRGNHSVLIDHPLTQGQLETETD